MKAFTVKPILSGAILDLQLNPLPNNLGTSLRPDASECRSASIPGPPAVSSSAAHSSRRQVRSLAGTSEVTDHITDLNARKK